MYTRHARERKVSFVKILRTVKNDFHPCRQVYPLHASERFERWAQAVGPQTELLIGILLQSRRSPEQSYRTCMGILQLSKRYTKERLEAACERAVYSGLRRVSEIRSILEKGLDKHPLPCASAEHLSSIQHNNIRGGGLN